MLLLVSDHTTPDKFENGNGEAHTVHINPSPQRIFSKTVFKSKEFENAGSSFSCGQKIFCKRGFSKTMVSFNNHLIFQPGDCCAHKFPQRRLSERKTFDAFSDGVKPLFQISVKHLPE